MGRGLPELPVVFAGPEVTVYELAAKDELIDDVESSGHTWSFSWPASWAGCFTTDVEVEG